MRWGGGGEEIGERVRRNDYGFTSFGGIFGGEYIAALNFCKKYGGQGGKRGRCAEAGQGGKRGWRYGKILSQIRKKVLHFLSHRAIMGRSPKTRLCEAVRKYGKPPLIGGESRTL